MKKTFVIATLCAFFVGAKAQCGWTGYEVKAENNYTNYNVRYASNATTTPNVCVASI